MGREGTRTIPREGWHIEGDSGLDFEGFGGKYEIIEGDPGFIAPEDTGV